MGIGFLDFGLEQFNQSAQFVEFFFGQFAPAAYLR
jgi:hypothetical protein